MEEMNELITIEDGVAKALPEVITKLKEAELTIKLLKDMQKNYKEKLLQEMEDKGVIKIDTPELSITYVAPTTRSGLDIDRLKEEKPEIYEEYLQISDVASSVKITCKKPKKSK